MASLALIWDLIARDNASPTFARVGASAEAAGAKTEAASKKIDHMSTVFAGVALAMGGVEVIKAATNFQSKMLLLQTQAGQSSTAVSAMSKSVVAMAGQVGTAPDKLANSLYHVVSTGLKGSQALDAMKIAAEGAKVGHADLEQTTNALTAAVASGIPGVQNMSQAMGVLNAIVGAGDMSMSDLTDAMGTGGLTVLKGYGLSLNDVGAALATFGDNNIRGADAMTMLRMGVQAMAKPMAEGQSELQGMGLSMTQLRDDLTTGGLRKAMSDLVAHLDAAGITGTKVGGVLTDIFGKKAGPGVAVLVSQFDRLNTKFGETARGADTFGQSWNTWLKSNQGQMDILKGKVEGFEVNLGDKLLPILNTTLGFINHHSKALIDLVGAFIAVKVAIVTIETATRGWTAATTVATAAQKLLGKTATTASTEQVAANDAAGASAVRLGASSKLGALGVAGIAAAAGAGIYELGKMADANNSFAHQLDSMGKNTGSLTTALVNNHGALDDNIKSIVSAQLASNGLADKAAKAGITTAQLTAAVTGSDSALGGLIGKWKAAGKPSSDTIAALGLMAGSYREAAAAGAKTATTTDVATAATKFSAQATGKNAKALVDAAGALKDNSKLTAAQAKVVDQAKGEILAAAAAAVTLKDGLTKLNTSTLNVKGSQLSFLDSVSSLTEGLKQNGKSLSDNTDNGRKNQEALLASIQAAQAHATALEDSGKSAATAARAYLTDEAALKKAASAAGLSTTAVAAMITKYGAVPKDIQTQINVQDAAAARTLASYKATLAALPKSLRTKVDLENITTAEYQLERLARSRTASITVSVGGQGLTGMRSVGGTAVLDTVKRAAGGWMRGPGSGTSDSILARLSNGEFVVNAHASKMFGPLLEKINGYATGGFVGPDGTRYPTLAAEHTAEATASRQKMQQTLLVKIDGTDAHRLFVDLFGTVKTLGNATFSLLSDIQKASREGVRGTSVLGTLQDENTKLMAEANKRVQVASQLKSAQAQLAAVQGKFATTASNVKSAIMGGFNITSSGGDPTLLLTTLRSQAVAAAKFGSQLSTLHKRGLTDTLLQQLADAGVGAGSATAAGLLKASPQSLKSIDAAFGKLNTSATHSGNQIAGSLYGAGVNAAKGLVRGLQSQQKSLEAQMKTLADTMVNQIKKDLKIHSPSLVAHQIGSFFGQGIVTGLDSHRPHVIAASSRLTGALSGGYGKVGMLNGHGEKHFTMQHVENQHIYEKSDADLVARKLEFAIRSGG